MTITDANRAKIVFSGLSRKNAKSSTNEGGTGNTDPVVKSFRQPPKDEISSSEDDSDVEVPSCPRSPVQEDTVVDFRTGSDDESTPASFAAGLHPSQPGSLSTVSPHNRLTSDGDNLEAALRSPEKLRDIDTNATRVHVPAVSARSPSVIAATLALQSTKDVPGNDERTPTPNILDDSGADHRTSSSSLHRLWTAYQLLDEVDSSSTSGLLEAHKDVDERPTSTSHASAPVYAILYASVWATTSLRDHLLGAFHAIFANVGASRIPAARRSRSPSEAIAAIRGNVAADSPSPVSKTKFHSFWTTKVTVRTPAGLFVNSREMARSAAFARWPSLDSGRRQAMLKSDMETVAAVVSAGFEGVLDESWLQPLSFLLDTLKQSAADTLPAAFRWLCRKLMHSQVGAGSATQSSSLRLKSNTEFETIQSHGLRVYALVIKQALVPFLEEEFRAATLADEAAGDLIAGRKEPTLFIFHNCLGLTC